VTESNFRRWRRPQSVAVPTAPIDRLPSFEAAGLFVINALLPDHCSRSVDKLLESYSDTSRRAGRTAMRTLLEYRYVVRVRYRGPGGLYYTDVLHQTMEFTEDDLLDVATDYGPGTFIVSWRGTDRVTAERQLVPYHRDTATRPSTARGPVDNRPARSAGAGTSGRPAKKGPPPSSRRDTAHRPLGGRSAISIRETPPSGVCLSPESPAPGHDQQPAPDGRTESAPSITTTAAPPTGERSGAEQGASIVEQAASIVAELNLGSLGPSRSQLRTLQERIEAVLTAGTSYREVRVHAYRKAEQARTMKYLLDGFLPAHLPWKLGLPKPGPATSARPAWCGECDERTRYIENADREPVRCDLCHPRGPQRRRHDTLV
jgi:hypothetical protein